MNLGRCLGVAFVVVSAFGCAAAPKAELETPASTTRITSVEVEPAADAPKVGKPQHDGPSKVEAEEAKDDDCPRRGDHRMVGGFSGYK